MKISLILISLIFTQVVYAELPAIGFLQMVKNYKEGENAIITAVLTSPTNVEVSVLVVPNYLNSQASELDHSLGQFAKIIIAPGQTQGSISFKVNTDDEYEGNENLQLRMTAPQNARQTNSIMTVTIRDAFEIDLPIVNFTATTHQVFEGNFVELKAVLSTPSSSIVIVPVSVSGSATHYVDHNLHYMDEFVFYPGMTEATLSVSAFDDAIEEPEENIYIKMIAPIVNARRGEMREANILINDHAL